jgi:hypothetical protein
VASPSIGILGAEQLAMGPYRPLQTGARTQVLDILEVISYLRAGRT